MPYMYGRPHGHSSHLTFCFFRESGYLFGPPAAQEQLVFPCKSNPNPKPEFELSARRWGIFKTELHLSVAEHRGFTIRKTSQSLDHAFVYRPRVSP